MPTVTATLASINPATGETVGDVPVTNSADIPGIVAAARAAQVGWGALTPAERAEMLKAAGQSLLDDAADLGELLTREMGKPLAEGIGEVEACGNQLLGGVPDMVEAFAPEQLEDEKTTTTLYYDPFGVVAAITPWNFPMMMPQWMVVPALIAGNAVVLKPSEETPLIAQAYAEALMEVLPENVLQIVHGADDQGKALVDADVDLIGFTGSRQVGEKIMAAAAPGLKRIILELGSKDPLVVLEDADVDAAAAYAANNSFRNCGQVCVSTERIYVKREIADVFVDKLIEASRGFKVGDGMDAGTEVGPMIHAAQKEHVMNQLDRAIEQGANVKFGGNDLPGNFVSPTVLTDLTHEMGIMTEETFGPIACVCVVDSDDEAVTKANDTIYGLGASVFGAEEHAAAVARRLTAGMIGINKSVGGSKGSPWVGARKSGYSYHKGPMGDRQFCQVRVISRVKG